MSEKKKESFATYRRILKMDKMIASGSYPSVHNFMDEFEISEATVNRDLDALRRDYGAEDILIYDRQKKGFYYSQKTFRLPAMLTSAKQIIAAKQMSNLLELIKGTPIYNQAIEVFKSLSENIDQDKNLTAQKLNNRILFLEIAPVKIDDETWELLEKAMSKNNYITFDYTKDKKTYSITVEPWQLIYFRGMWTLYCYNLEYKEPRFYNLPVIKNIKIKKETFELPKDFEYEKHANGNFGRYIENQTYQFKIKIMSQIESDFVETYTWAPDQTFKKQKDNTTIMTFSSNQYYPVLHWVLEKGMYALPLKPERLVNEWKENVQRMNEMVKGKSI